MGVIRQRTVARQKKNTEYYRIVIILMYLREEDKKINKNFLSLSH
jgi:hypothetical protein